MDLAVNYLGMPLRTPIVASSSPLMDEIDNIKRMEDAGASAVVLYSLFEEQLTREHDALQYHLTHGTESFAESLSYLPAPEEYKVGPEGYLDHIRKAKAAIDIPVVASLNGSSIGGWADYAKGMQEAGADALELNVYFIPTSPDITSAEVEKTYLDILKAVKSAVNIPIALKLGPFFSNMAYMAKLFDQAGADGLVLFNRFYQPDMDLDELEVTPNVLLSTPQAMRLPLRWIAILYGKIQANLAATSGIHTSQDVLKVVMAGADVAMVCSVLLQRGIECIREIESGIARWMEEHEYESIAQMQGSMSQKNIADSAAFERAQYMKAILTFKPTV